MKNILKILIISLCMLLSMNVIAQQNSEADRKKAEKNTAPFSPDYFNVKKNSYYVLTTSFADNKLIIDDKAKIVEVGGKFPYPSGQLNVRVMNRDGKVISSFFMQDPMVIRSCDDEKSEVQRLGKGTIQIPLPRSKDIAMIELVREKKSLGRTDIRKVMEKFLKERQNKD